MRSAHLMSGGRYPVLRSLAILYLVGGGVAALGGVMVAGWCLFGAPQSMENRVILAVSVLAATFFVVLTLLAIAEVLKLFIDIEHNSRTRAMSDGNPEAKAMEIEDHRIGRMQQWMEGEETAEGALLRGH